MKLLLKVLVESFRQDGTTLDKGGNYSFEMDLNGLIQPFWSTFISAFSIVWINIRENKLYTFGIDLYHDIMGSFHVFRCILNRNG